MAVYIVQNVYKPNEATTNRLLAIIKSLNNLGLKATVLFLMPDAKRSKVKFNLSNIQFEYLWEGRAFSNKYLKYLTGFFSALKLRCRIKDGDILLMYDVCFWDVLLSSNKVKYYYEVTESPDIISFPTLPFDFRNKRYYSYCKRMAGMFVITDALRVLFEEKGIKKGKIHKINMIVDIERFEGLQKNCSEKRIVYCGTASNNKDGVDQLIKAFFIFSQTHPDVKLYIYGKTPQKNQAFANGELVKSLSLQDKVIFGGVIRSEEMPQVLKDASVLALNRPDNKQARFGFPTKLGEYLATGNPVVVTKVGEIPFYLEDGISALLATPDNPVSFATKLSWAFDNPIIASSIGICGRQVVEKYFSADKESKKLKDILQQYD